MVKMVKSTMVTMTVMATATAMEKAMATATGWRYQPGG